MFKTIVVGTDGSADARRALQLAVDLAGAQPSADVHVVTAFHPLSGADLQAMADSLPAEFHPLVYGDMGAESRIAQARQIMSAGGIEATYHELDADPTDALLDTVDANQADLLVVGSRGEGAAKRLIHGSVSTKVLHHAPCAVLVVKADR